MTAPRIERNEVALAAEVSRLVATKNFDATSPANRSARIAACNNTLSAVATAIEKEVAWIGGRG